jgi:UDP-N-acetylglucosamine 2-epimerase (non-hydrolysing)
MRLVIVAGARPNFMKIAPMIHAINRRRSEGDTSIEFKLVHTGQHYDEQMSHAFFRELNIPAPDHNLEVGSGTQSEQTGAIMTRFEQFLSENPTDLVLVVGDVNSTMACTITAKKLGIRVAHVEAGIRSGDMTMPEEINRIVTDSICDYFFTTSEGAGRNLVQAGAKPESIFFVGNTMIDTLLYQTPNFKKPGFIPGEVKEGDYLVLTLHRPHNVDNPDKLKTILDIVNTELVRNGVRAVFPVHPRTRGVLSKMNVSFSAIYLTDPMTYLEFMYLIKHSRGVVTDSGGVTEETTVMGVPCMTLRNSTERPETVTVGTNELIGEQFDKIPAKVKSMLQGGWKKGGIPEKWDGKTAERIVDVLKAL